MIIRRATFEEVPAAMALAHESFMSAVALAAHLAH
jgi:hypothetical protein